MIHNKINDDGYRTVQNPEQEFYQYIKPLGMNVWKDADTGLFTNKSTQDAYENWKKSR